MIIITGDKDILQLVSDHIQVYDPMKEKRFGVEEVIDRFGLPTRTDGGDDGPGRRCH